MAALLTFQTGLPLGYPGDASSRMQPYLFEDSGFGSVYWYLGVTRLGYIRVKFQFSSFLSSFSL